MINKLDVGPFILGGNVFGWTVSREEGFQILDAFVERGGRMIDTADLYAAGQSETIIGEWLASRGVRDAVMIATKVAKWPQRPGLSAANIAAAIEGSLRRLRTDHVDLYYAHEDDLEVEQLSYLTSFDSLVREGRVRALGASNFS
ncbi:MAG: aldo/keto reductase, partial [Kofleriaceae bacterium]